MDIRLQKSAWNSYGHYPIEPSRSLQADNSAQLLQDLNDVRQNGRPCRLKLHYLHSAGELEILHALSMRILIVMAYYNA